MKNKDKIVGSITILIVGVLFLVVGYFISEPQEIDTKNYSEIFIEHEIDKDNKAIEIYSSEISSDSIKVNESQQFEYITVDIKGAVVKPGAYEILNGSRIKDLIELAGGFTKEADIVKVHLSKKLYDEDYVYISKVGEEAREDIPVNLNNDNTSSKESVIHNETNKIDINTANIEGLKTLPGIGDVKAKSIIKYREQNGRFKSIDELNNVKGIGPSTFADLSGLVVAR